MTKRLTTATRTGRHAALRTYVLPLLAAVLLAACGKSADKTNEPSIAVTVEPLRYFAEALADGRFRVTSIVPEGSSPETYDPTPQQLVQFAESKAWLLAGGLGFEKAWAERLKETNPDMPFYNLSEGIELVRSAHSHGHGAESDPHVWNSVRNARLIARNVCRALCEIDPAGTSHYRHRLDSLSRVFDRTELAVAREIEGAAPAFLIHHPALAYFARDWGLEQICIEEDGKEPTPARLRELVRLCREKHVCTVFIQKEFDRRHAELIAAELGLEPVAVNPLSYRWDEEMLHTARALGSNRQTPKQRK